MKTIRYSHIVIFAALAMLVSGCKSPMQEVQARHPNWEKAAKYMVSERDFGARDLIWKPFPNVNNPVHQEIWKALWQKRRFGDGYGTICEYYDSYLVIESDFNDHGRMASFCYPRQGFVIPASVTMAFRRYRGDRSATISNIRNVMDHLLAVSEYKAFEVDDYNQIPHAGFQKDNPNLSFSDYLAAKGITIHPPAILKKNERADHSAYSECSVFVYEPCGGRLFRYEMQCMNGQITDVESFLIGGDIGDCWYII